MGHYLTIQHHLVLIMFDAGVKTVFPFIVLIAYVYIKL